MNSTVSTIAKIFTFIFAIVICLQTYTFGQGEPQSNRKDEGDFAPITESRAVKQQSAPVQPTPEQKAQPSPKAERQRRVESQETPGNLPPAAMPEASLPVYVPPSATLTNKQIEEGMRRSMQEFEEQRRQDTRQAQQQLDDITRQDAAEQERRRQGYEQYQEQLAQQQRVREERQRQSEAEQERKDKEVQKEAERAAKWFWIVPVVELLLFAGLLFTAFKTGHAKKSAMAMLIGAAMQFLAVLVGLVALGTSFFQFVGISKLSPPNIQGTPTAYVVVAAFVFAVLGFYLYTCGKIGTLISLCTAPPTLAKRLFCVFGVSVGLIGIYGMVTTIAPAALYGTFCSLIVLFVGTVVALVKSGQNNDEGLHGSARFAQRKEFKELEKPLEAGGFILAPAHPENKHGKLVLPRHLSVMHGLILGGSGTGKSRGYFMANCAEAKNTSLVVTDPKSELWKLTSGFHHKALRYAPVEPDSSFCFNWIPLCTDARMAELCARAIMTAGSTKNTDQFWIDSETAFLSAVFAHAATTEFPTPMTAYRLFTRQKPEELLEQLEHSPSAVAREQAVIFKQTDARIKGAIVPAIAARMQFMRDPNIQVFTSAHTDAPDFGALRRSPTAVYWCLREQDISRLRPLTSLFFTVLLEQIAGEQILEGESEVPITMMLDEFANIGTIPDFETTISLARGRGVGIWLGVQSLSQLSKAYGQDNAQTIMSNCTTKIALHGLDYQTAEYVSKMLGEQTISHNRTGFGFGMSGVSMNTGAAQHRRQLLTADEVMRIGETEAIARTSNKYPMRIYKGYYNEPPKTAPVTQTLLQIQAADVGADEEVLAV